MTDFEKARALLRQFKGSSYLFGTDVLARAGEVAATAGTKVALIRDTFDGSEDSVEMIRKSLEKSGVNLVTEIKGAGPNCPRKDLFRIADGLRETEVDVLVSFGGGSTIDAAKAAEVLLALNGGIDTFFGTGLVTKALQEKNKSLIPHVAIQTVASSAAHLTKYSNITDVSTGQKKLIVDDAIVPPYPVFDYEVTYSTPPGLTADGALDGIAHSLEVLYGAVGKPYYDKVEEVAGIGIALVVVDGGMVVAVAAGRGYVIGYDDHNYQIASRNISTDINYGAGASRFGPVVAAFALITECHYKVLVSLT